MTVNPNKNVERRLAVLQTYSATAEEEDLYQREERERFAEYGKQLARRTYGTDISELLAYDDSLDLGELEQLISEATGWAHHLTEREANDVIRTAIDRARKSD